VGAIYDAMNHPRDDSVLLSLIDERAEFINPDHAVDPGIRYGHKGFLAALASLDNAFDEHGQEVERLVDVGDDRVLAFTIFRARGRDSGAQLEVAEQNLWTLADGKVTRYEWFHDREQALEAAGIEE
jgi:ketosteroid isomerase-like protein